MADNKLNWLEEVKADADFNVKRRLREQQEKQAFEASKTSGDPLPGQGSNYVPAEEEKKGKK